MTCIVGVVEGDKIWIGADSVATHGNESILLKQPKVFRNGSFLFGCSGRPRHAQILESSEFNPPKIKDKQSVDGYLAIDVIGHIRQIFRTHGAIDVYNGQSEEMSSCFLMGFGTGLYMIDGAFQISSRLDSFDATGSGGQYALGALQAISNLKLSPRKKIELALKSAERFDPYVQGPFKILNMKAG